MRTYDALVVGGGPAGSSAALRLRAAGLAVVVIDTARFPRDKPCAGWITPEVVSALGLDVEDYRRGRTWQPITGFRTGPIAGPAVLTRYGRPVSFAVRRCEFDAYLLRRSGATLRLGAPARRLERGGGTWTVDGDVRAPVLVGAGGHFCPVARLLNGTPASSAVVAAQEAEFPLRGRDADRFAPDVPALYFSPDLQGYGWCVRKGGYLNVGLGRRDPRRLGGHIRGFLDHLRRVGELPESLPARWRGHAYLLYDRASGRAEVVDDGVVLAGDAAALAYPASGEGILPAVESGLLAADAILGAGGRYDRDRLEPYRAALESRRGPRGARRSLPPSLAAFLAGPLLGSRWFARHMLIDRFFLHIREDQGEVVGPVSPAAQAAGGRCFRPCLDIHSVDHRH
jgi:menaquinone-9 beta-reductase